MPKSEDFRYTEEHPYISDGGGRNSIKGKKYTGIEADVAEFEDIFFNHPFNGGVNKFGLGIDEFCDALTEYGHVKSLLIDLELQFGQQGASKNLYMFCAA